MTKIWKKIKNTNFHFVCSDGTVKAGPRMVRQVGNGKHLRMIPVDEEIIVPLPVNKNYPDKLYIRIIEFDPKTGARFSQQILLSKIMSEHFPESKNLER